MNTPRIIVTFNSFKREAKKHFEHLISPEWAEVLFCLVNRLPMPIKYRDHQLTGKLKGLRDCHVKNDLVLIYKISDDDQMLELYHLDTHSEIFKNANAK